MDKYENLVDILDQLRREAPIGSKKYRPAPSNLPGVDQSRARSLIHLFLKVRFGVLEFQNREKFVTDGSYDGGIDAYFIDEVNKKVYLIQSKFRTSKKNFEKKNITFDELLKMDVERVLDGETHDEEGNKYNGKINQLQREVNQISDIGRWDYVVVILANTPKMKISQMKKLVGGFDTEIFDNESIYKQLVFPVITGTYYNCNELSIRLNLSDKNTQAARIDYNVETEYEDCDITVVFVPIKEIGRILYKYQNSILKFNPRCFLEMKAKTVNDDIYKTVKNRKTNEFALFNNGLTMLSDDTSINARVAKKGEAQIVITNPQLINGGQTSYTLSRLYEEVINGVTDEIVFEGKEVLLKIITFGDSSSSDQTSKRKLIEDISKATNRQTQVSDADRRSNDRIQIELQELIFDKFGYYYERKRGEFANGIRDGYVNRKQIINRDHLLRVAACCNRQPSMTKTSILKLYSDELFLKLLDHKERYVEFFYGYKVLQLLSEKLKASKKDTNDPYAIDTFGNALRYGQFAVVAIVVARYFENERSLSSLLEDVEAVLDDWRHFEETASEYPTNSSYFRRYKEESSGETIAELNYDGYYKGSTLDNDLRNYFDL